AVVTQRSMLSSSLRHGITTETTISSSGATISASVEADVLWKVLMRAGGRTRGVAPRLERWTAPKVAPVRASRVANRHADLPRLRLPVPVHRGRRGAVV